MPLPRHSPLKSLNLVSATAADGRTIHVTIAIDAAKDLTKPMPVAALANAAIGKTGIKATGLETWWKFWDDT